MKISGWFVNHSYWLIDLCEVSILLRLDGKGVSGMTQCSAIKNILLTCNMIYKHMFNFPIGKINAFSTESEKLSA
jgi:hypothetical protein